jgi:hypothetical protein
MNRILMYAFAGLLLIAGLMLGRILILEGKVEKGKEYEGLYKSSAVEAKVWKDKHDQWHSKAQELAVSNSTLKQMSRQDPDLIRLLLEVKDIKKNLSNLQSFNSVGTHTETRFNVRMKDTTIATGGKAKFFDYETKWDKYKGMIIGDSAFLQRDGRDSLAIAAYWTRKWFLAKKKYFSEVISANPDTKITYNRSLIVKRKRKNGQ